MSPGARKEISLRSSQLKNILSTLSNTSNKGKLILVLGAGASKNIDETKPDWKTLAKKIVSEYNRIPKFKNEDVLRHCKNILKENNR